MNQTFYGWVHELSQAEDIAEFTTVMGSTTAKAYTQITAAMTLIHGLPKFYQRCLAGDFTIEHVNATAHACKDVKFENLPAVDDYLAERRADITIETFKKSLGMKIAVLEPLEDRLEEASKRRRVDITTTPDGTAYLTLTGPAPELQACYLRIAAFARAIHSGNIAPFSDQMPTGASMDDDRGIDALMFDILTRTCPQLKIQVTSNNTTTGETSTRDIPLDRDGLNGTSVTPEDVINAVNEAAAGATSSAESAAGSGARSGRAAGDEDVQAFAVLTMPTHGQWFESQARMITTVPFLTLTGDSDLPGSFSSGSPIPADTVRRVAGHSKTWTRILTDPATGTPIDAKATTYQIPAAIRQTLVAKWQMCTIPGCIRRAETSEIDHIVPFDHDHPEQGGLTRFENLHPLCKMHHQAKTDRRYSVRMPRTGLLEYVFRHGITAEVSPGDHPINAEHAKLFDEVHFREKPPPGTGDQVNGIPDPTNPPAPKSPPVGRPFHGDTCVSEQRPGPAPGDGKPGWVKSNPFISSSTVQNEWIWDSGERPPF